MSFSLFKNGMGKSHVWFSLFPLWSNTFNSVLFIESVLRLAEELVTHRPDVCIIPYCFLASRVGNLYFLEAKKEILLQNVSSYDPKYHIIQLCKGKGNQMTWSRILTCLSSPIPAKLLIPFLFVNHSTLTHLCHRQLLLLAGPSEGFPGHCLWHNAKWIVGWMIDNQISILPCGRAKHNCYYYVWSLSKYHVK